MAGVERGGIVVVTGCTNGLGFSCVQHLAKSTLATIVLACRKVDAAQSAASLIASREGCPEDRLVVLPEALDLADLVSVRSFAAALRVWLGDRRLTSLVNNAGIGGSTEFRKTAQGHEAIWGTNHLGHFLLTLLLLPSLREGARIVNVSSEVHDPANEAPLPDPGQHWPTNQEEYDRHLAGGLPVNDEDDRTSGGRRYSRSKLCNVFFTNELARRLSGAVPREVEVAVAKASAALKTNACCKLPGAGNIEVIAMNPGLMLETNFFSAAMGPVSGFIAWLLMPLLRCTTRLGSFMRSMDESGSDLAELALGALPAGGETAAYYDGRKLKASSEFSRCQEGVCRYQEELWVHSLRWAAVTTQELAAAGFV